MPLTLFDGLPDLCNIGCHCTADLTCLVSP